MSIKTKLVTAATTLTVIVGAGAAGTLTANAATPKCGQICTDLYNQATGTGFVLSAPAQAGRAGLPVWMARASRASKREDFAVDHLGTVHDFYHAGLVSGGLNKLYGSLATYEIEYAPGASSSGLCLGTAVRPGAGTPVTLEPCGVQASTVWIVVPQKTGFVLISAATADPAHHAYALTALRPGTPLVTAQLVANTAAAFARQVWGAQQGVLPH